VSDLDSEVDMAKLSSDEMEGVSCSSPGTDPQLAHMCCRPRTTCVTVASIVVVYDYQVEVLILLYHQLHLQ